MGSFIVFNKENEFLLKVETCTDHLRAKEGRWKWWHSTDEWSYMFLFNYDGHDG